MRKAAYYVGYAVLIFVAWYAVGCTSPAKKRLDDAVLKHQQQLTDLEDRNQDLERRLVAYDNAVGDSLKDLEAIRTRGTELEGTVDETIELFDEYQREVERVISSLRAVQGTVTADP
jgi:chromosome segregation ATPase